MATSADSPRENRDMDNQPNAARHAEFAGDETGRIAGSVAPTTAPSTLPHQVQTGGAHGENPGLPANTHEDPGWEREEQGSTLAYEREGVPQDDIPHNVPDSATRTRTPAP